MQDRPIEGGREGQRESERARERESNVARTSRLDSVAAAAEIK